MERSRFGEENIIQRTELRGIKYNTKVTRPENCEVVTVSHGSAQRLKCIEGNLINPHKRPLFGTDKIDPNEYVVFFMDSAFHDATWGGNVTYADSRVGGITEKVNIRANFSFRIERGDRVLTLLSETKSTYSRKYLVEKLRHKIDNTIKSSVSRILYDRGFIAAQQEITAVSEQAQERINRDILSSFGMVMSDLNLVLEEDQDHADERDRIEWSLFKENIKETGVDK